MRVIGADYGGRGRSGDHGPEVQYYRVLLDNAPIALAVVGTDGVIEYANPSAGELADAAHASELIGLHVCVFVRPEQRSHLNELLARARSGHTTPGNAPIRRAGVSLKSRTFYAEVSAGLVEFGGNRAVLLQAKDVTGQVGAENAARRHVMRLRALKSELASIEERRRMDLARALHDNVGQPLAMARLAIQSWAAEPGARDEELERALRLLDSAISETRELTTELVPQLLHDFGTAAAVRRLAEDMESNYGLHVSVQGRLDDVGVSMEARAVFFRSVREILINAAKHAGVVEARVTLSETTDLIRVEVEDDGVGFDPNMSPREHSFGLFSIQDRLPLLGGGMEIDSAPGRGTRVRLWVARNADRRLGR